MSFVPSQKYSRPILRPLRLTNPGTTAPTLSGTPRRRESQSTSSAWRATTHVFTGTGNRQIPRCWHPSKFDQDPQLILDDTKYDDLYDPATAVMQDGRTYHMYESNDAPHQEVEPVPVPHLVVKRYIPKSDSETRTGTGLTLLLLPGMGVPKEMFEPLIELLLPKLQATGQQIDEIWSLDMPMSGETALINPFGYLYGNEKDIARDLLLFVTAYLPLAPWDDLPERLYPRKTSLKDPEQQHPVRSRLHVIAHSLGAQCAMMAAAHAPNIFASLTVLDPAIIPPGSITKAYTKLPKDVYCTNIPEKHADAASLVVSLRSNKRTRGWSRDSVRAFVKWGAVPEEKGGAALRLIAHPRLEWALYYDKETPTQTYDRLLDISVPFHAVMPTRPFAVPPKQFKADVARLSQTKHVTWIDDSTHQLPYEKTSECADAIESWLRDVALPGRPRL